MAALIAGKADIEAKDTVRGAEGGGMRKRAGAVGRGAGWKHAAWRAWGAGPVAGQDDSDRQEGEREWNKNDR